MSNKKLEAKTLEQHIASVDYEYMNKKYIPSIFALKMYNFIQLVTAEEPESNKTPPMHLMMLDKLVDRICNYVVNVVFRGGAKTSIMGEFLVLYAGAFHSIPELKLPVIDLIIYMSDTMENGAKSFRKNVESRYERSSYLKSLIPKVKFTDTAIEMINSEGKKTVCKLYGATTGIRGVKSAGKRPVLAILDDLMSDEAAKSKTVLNSIKDTIYNGLINAMDPTNNLIIFSGTPFNKEDPIVTAVESGAWEVNVYPICAKFPCSKKEFQPAWGDRFPYEVVKDKYEFAVRNKKPSSFFQELMLQITSDEDRLVSEEDILWYKQAEMLNNNYLYNYYITTDFAYSEKQSADYSVIMVWGYSQDNKWYLVDGICKRQAIDTSINDLFSFITKYNPKSVGIEVTGQQSTVVSWLQSQMHSRSIYFSLASSNNGKSPGIRPMANKLARFQMVTNLFKSGRILFPKELDTTKFMQEIISEIRLATLSGLNGKDDCLDAISMLSVMQAWSPSKDIEKSNPNISNTQPLENIWGDSYNYRTSSSDNALDSYLV